MQRSKLWILIVVILLLFSSVGIVALSRASANPHATPLWWNSPFIGGHMYSVALLPCSPTTPGQLLFMQDALLSSRFPAPGLSIPLSSACP